MSDISIIIPSRGYIRAEVVSSLLSMGFTIYIRVDDGRGQNKIRQDIARECNTPLIFLLDDDIELPSNGVQDMFRCLQDGGYDAVCGEVVPVALNNFSKQVLQWKVNKETFYPTGITLWRTDKYLYVMDSIPKDTDNFAVDVAMGQVIRDKGLKVGKLPIEAKHFADTDPWKFFRYRYRSGVALGLNAYRNGGYLSLLFRFAAGLPLSRSRGIFIYRLGTLSGVVTSLLLRKKEGS